MPEEKQKESIEHLRKLSIEKKSERTKEQREVTNTDERESWAWALKTLRRLRREGIDLEPELDTPDKILKGIQAALDTRREGLSPVELTKLVREALFQED